MLYQADPARGKRMIKSLGVSFLLALAPLTASAGSFDHIIDVVETQLINPIKYLLIVCAVLLFLYGVIEMIMGASNETARTKGKTHMIWGLVGLVIIFAVDSIVAVITNFTNSL